MESLLYRCPHCQQPIEIEESLAANLITCPNPDCDATELVETPLSRRGRIWSYTENHYAPPAPYVAAEPFEPYALAAVELEAEGLVILGQVAKGVMAADLEIGMEVEVDLQVLFTDDEGNEKWIWTWAPAAPREVGQ